MSNFGPPKDCPLCKGTGTIIQDVMGMDEHIRCHFCGGTGKHRDRLTIDERKETDMTIDLTDAEVDALIRSSFEPKIPARVMPKPGPAARHNFRAGVAYGLAAGRERAIDECARVCTDRMNGAPGPYAAEAQLCAAAIRALKQP